MTIHSVVIQKLLSTNAHMGRLVAAHHFKIYSYGARNGLTIIDSDKTLICLRNACNFIGELARAKGRFLFVNTNSLFDDIIDHMTKTIGIKNDRSWRLGGFLTNSLSPKKFRGRNKKLILGAVVPPDCVVIFDTERKSSVILEASKLQVPIVGLVSPSMPWETYKRITYPVPANDSVQFVYLFCNLITKTFLYEQRRLKDTLKTDSHAEGKLQESETAKKKGEIFVIPYETLPTVSDDLIMKKLLNKVIVLKLNATSGTKMGLTGPKSTIELYDGTTCLDITISQIESLNLKYGCSIPLLLADTIDTHDATLKVLERYPGKNIHTLLQSAQQESVGEDLLDDEDKLDTEAKSDDAMFPSNLGEIFISLKKSGKLEVLLSQGMDYILVLGSENLAQVVDLNILNYLVEKDIESCVEVVPASVDFKESNLSADEGKLESKEKLKSTNTMWVSMTSIYRFLQKKSRIENHTFSESFDEAVAIKIPKSRYLPVEKTSDLLRFQSDLYSVVNGILTRNIARADPADPSIELGPEFANLSEFRNRFKSIPSIVELDSLKVTGNVWFGAGVTLKGKVIIAGSPDMKIVIPDGTILGNKVITRQNDIEESLVGGGVAM